MATFYRIITLLPGERRRAVPKSTILTVVPSFSVHMMFSGLRSMWTMCWSCRYST